MGIYQYNLHEVVLQDEVGSGDLRCLGVTCPPVVSPLNHTMEGSPINSLVHKAGP